MCSTVEECSTSWGCSIRAEGVQYKLGTSEEQPEGKQYMLMDTRSAGWGMHNKKFPPGCTAMPFYMVILAGIENWEIERHVTKIVLQHLINHKLTSGARSAPRVETERTSLIFQERFWLLVIFTLQPNSPKCNILLISPSLNRNEAVLGKSNFVQFDHSLKNNVSKEATGTQFIGKEKINLNFLDFGHQMKTRIWNYINKGKSVNHFTRIKIHTNPQYFSKVKTSSRHNFVTVIMLNIDKQCILTKFIYILKYLLLFKMDGLIITEWRWFTYCFITLIFGFSCLMSFKSSC